MKALNDKTLPHFRHSSLNRWGLFILREGIEMKVLVIHGPNLNMLGKRKEGIYGKETLEEIDSMLERQAKDLGIEITSFQSNSEGALIDFVQAESSKADGIIINLS